MPGQFVGEIRLDAGQVDGAVCDLFRCRAQQTVQTRRFGAFRLAQEDLGWSLPRALSTVTSVPAAPVGLDDRGRLEPGLRADLVRVQMVQSRPVVRAVWCGGVRVM